MLATEASGVWPVMACQSRQSQLTTVAADNCGSYRALQEHVADGLGLGGGAAAGKRATCLLRSGSANVGTEGPTHHAAVQNAPPQDPVLPVEVGSTS